MYEFLRNLLSDKNGGEIFTCFGVWHVCYIVSFLAIGICVCLYLRNKDSKERKQFTDGFINLAFITYIADFFLMPFAYGEIDIEKLPFHICTAMCVMCFLSRYNNFAKKYKLQFAVLGFISNLVYLVYPAGIMWHGVHPLSYRVIQTLSFHGIMMVYGLLVLMYESEEFEWKKCYKDFFVIASMTLWALVGNAMYNSELRLYNWFFVVQDPFNLFPQSFAQYIMPILNIVIFLTVEFFVYFIFLKIARQLKNEN